MTEQMYPIIRRFVATHTGTRRPTGQVCEADHEYDPPRAEYPGEHYGYYVGQGCHHGVTRGYCTTAPLAEIHRDYYRAEHHELGHREPVDGCPICADLAG